MSTLHAEYKKYEKDYKDQLLGGSQAKERITTQTIKRGTDAAVQRTDRKFGEAELANLEKVINLRRIATKHFESLGIDCPGHKYWLKLLVWSHERLRVDWVTRTKDPIDLDFATLDIQDPTEDSIPSYEETIEDVWLLSGLDSIQEMGEWLKEMWRSVKLGDVCFATLGHGKLPSPGLQNLLCSRLNQTTVSNCLRDLVHREFIGQSLLQNLSDQKVFQQHPLIIEMAKAVKKKIKIPTLVSHSAILESISSASTVKEKKRIDTWLLSITEEQWFNDSNDGLGFARRTLLIHALSMELQSLQNDTPNAYLDPKVLGYPHSMSSNIKAATEKGLPPIWGLCDVAAEIAAKRHTIEWTCGETFARKRMLSCLSRKTENEQAVLDWLYGRWGNQIWPSGIPKDLATAYKLLGSTDARLNKIMARGRKNIAISSVLMDRHEGFGEVINRLKEDKVWWSSHTSPIAILEKVRFELEKENSSVFWLDGKGWDAVGAMNSRCPLEVLEASSERQQIQVNR